MSGQPTVAQLLNDLFRNHLKPDGQEYTNTDVSLALNNEISVSALSKLRRGEIPNPSRNVLLLLCQFFGVPASYFFPELERTPTLPSQANVVGVRPRTVGQITPGVKKYLSDMEQLLARLNSEWEQQQQEPEAE